MVSKVKPNTPRQLTEEETPSSFKNWQNILFTNLSCHELYKDFCKDGVTWEKVKANNPKRGFTGDDALVKAGNLNSMLNVISSYVPPHLATNILNNSTCLDDVWETIKVYFRFDQSSEAQFMKLEDIKWETDTSPPERPQRLYQRILAHFQDNLLQKNSKLKYHGETQTENEVMSPTVERFAVMKWMQLIHPKIPALVKRTFAYDLQRATLADLQPQICDALDGFLQEIRDEEAHVDRTRARQSQVDNDSDSGEDVAAAKAYFHKKFATKNFTKKSNKTTSKPCTICKLAGKTRRSYTHATDECELLHSIKSLKLSDVNELDDE